MYETIDIADQHRPVRNMRLPEVMYTTGLSRATIYVLMKRNEFPASHKLRANCISVGWYEDEIYAYAERDRAKPRPSSRQRLISDGEDVTASAAQSQRAEGKKTNPVVLRDPKTK